MPDSQKRLIDVTVPIDQEGVSAHLHRLADQCVAFESELRGRADRSERTEAFANFSAYAAGELRHVALFYPKDVPGLAWAARNLYELHLLVRFIMKSPDNFRAWIGQRLTDERDFIDGVLAYVDSDTDQTRVAVLKAQRLKLENAARKYNLPMAKPFQIRDLVAALGEQEEYGALFKLFSKYVHPSSLLINAWGRMPPDETYLDVFLVKAQVYAGQTLKLLQDGANA